MSFEVNVKRFYIPTEGHVKCPECGTEQPLINGHLSYPTANVVFDHQYYCGYEWKDDDGEWQDCGHEWTRKARLTIRFDLVAE